MSKKAKDENFNLFKRGNVWWIKIIRDGALVVKTTGETDVGKARIKRDSEVNPMHLRDQKERAEAVLAKVQTVEQALVRAENSRPALTVKNAWDAFKKSPERSDASERTLAGYYCQWTRFVNWIEKRRENSELRAVTAQDASDYAANLIEDEKGVRVTPNTFNKHIVLLEMIFRVLTDKARLGANPWVKIKRKRLATQGRRALTVAELQTVLEKATGELQTLLIIGAYSGLRLGDAVTLDWSAVDLARGIITLRPKKTASRTGKLVAIPIHPTLYAALSKTTEDNRKGAVLPELAKMREENPDGINYRLQKHFRECGIKTTEERDGAGRQVPVAGFHALRHTIVSQLASKGVPLETIRGLVGHGGESMTRAYVHQNAEAARAAVGELQALAPFSAADAAAAQLVAVQEQAEKLDVQQLEQLAMTIRKLIKTKKALQTTTAGKPNDTNPKQTGTVTEAKSTGPTGAVKQTDGRK